MCLSLCKCGSFSEETEEEEEEVFFLDSSKERLRSLGAACLWSWCCSKLNNSSPIWDLCKSKFSSVKGAKRECGRSSWAYSKEASLIISVWATWERIGWDLGADTAESGSNAVFSHVRGVW